MPHPLLIRDRLQLLQQRQQQQARYIIPVLRKWGASLLFPGTIQQSREKRVAIFKASLILLRAFESSLQHHFLLGRLFKLEISFTSEPNTVHGAVVSARKPHYHRLAATIGSLITSMSSFSFLLSLNGSCGSATVVSKYHIYLLSLPSPQTYEGEYRR